MRRVVAIASSDWHLHKFRDFDQNGSRLAWALKAAKLIMDQAVNYKVPLLFAGDLFHNAKEVENETLDLVVDLFRNFLGDFLCISGNHDMSQKNGKSNKSPTYLSSLAKAFPDRVYLMDGKGWPNNNLNVYGFDYYNDQEELVKAVKKLKPVDNGKLNILLLHGDPSGCIQPNGTEVNSDFPRDMDKFFKRWNLVLWGHIHKPQKLGKKSYMLGSPIHQNFGDRGIDMGYWKIYDDCSAEFISICDQFPCFIHTTSQKLQKLFRKKEVKEIDYVRLVDDVKEEKEIEGDFNVFKKTRKQLAKAYCKTKGIKDPVKKEALIHILNRV